MRGKQWLRESRQYALVYSEGRSRANNLAVMKSRPNGLTWSRYGFSISRRVGNAVVRNRVKRRFREILRVMPLQSGWDIIFIARPAANTNYANLKQAASRLLLQSGVLKTAEEETVSSKESGCQDKEFGLSTRRK